MLLPRDEKNFRDCIKLHASLVAAARQLFFEASVESRRSDRLHEPGTYDRDAGKKLIK
jgi:hypothetical protein